MTERLELLVGNKINDIKSIHVLVLGLGGVGGYATESIVISKELAELHYDGIVHIKSFGCTPEINAMPILDRISNEYDIPIIYFSFDSNQNKTAIDTRIEAFYDMLVQKKSKKDK